MTRINSLLVVASTTFGFSAQAEPYTQKHEAGRCALRGTCGGGGFFSPSLPCVDNGLAKDPEDGVRQKLVNICGAKWSQGPVCCEESQVSILVSHFLTYSNICLDPSLV